MEISEDGARVIPLDVALSTKRPWREWADGQWRLVPGLATDLRRYLRFRSSLHSWCNRNGFAASISRSAEGVVRFRIVRSGGE